MDDFGEGERLKEIPYQVIDSEGVVKIEKLLASQDQIIFFGYGASNYISDNDTAEGKAMNRRVEIKFNTIQ